MSLLNDMRNGKNITALHKYIAENGSWNKGKKLSDAHRAALSVAHKGIKYSDSMRQKTADRQRGEKSRFWKGGKTKESQIIRSSWQYAQWRKKVFERDNYICQHCGQKAGRLEADHIIPFSFILKEIEMGADKNSLFLIDNGRTLCISCHRKTRSWLGNYRQAPEWQLYDRIWSIWKAQNDPRGFEDYYDALMGSLIDHGAEIVEMYLPRH